MARVKLRKRKNDFKTFEEMEIGEVFLYDGEYFIKIEPALEPEDPETIRNAVGLFTGLIHTFFPDYKVASVNDCYMIIED